MEWIISNTGVLLTIGVVILSTVATWVRYGTRISQLEKDIEKLTRAVEELERIVRAHQSDTTLHIDPNRDKKIWDEFKSETMRRFDRLEEKIEKLMIIHPGPPV